MVTTMAFTTGVICEPCAHARIAARRVEMFDDSLDVVFSMVERAFMRIQAVDVLVTCLEKEDTTPIQNLVEGLVVAGPSSLNALREIRAEIDTRRTELQSEIARTFSSMEESLNNWGVNLTGLTERNSTHGLDAGYLGGLLRQQGIGDEHRLKECTHLLNSSKVVMSHLARQILLLDEVTIYLEDWMGGLMYQSAHQRGENLVSSPKTRLWQ
jgi:hypothetical protein